MGRKSKLGWLLGGLFLPVVALAFAVTTLLYHPQTPLPPEWNPTRPLDPKAPLTRITQWKLAGAVAEPQLCAAALERIAAPVVALPPQEQDDQCHIRNRVQLSNLATARIAPLETRCDIALRLAMWEHHGLQPAAQALLGAGISRIHHYGSYSCRTIAGSSRMSQHATANALDISGFDLTNGQKIRLRNDWQATGKTAEFLRSARNSACAWFRMVLSPDYNAAHHDHFHMDQGRWSGCR
ncbi:extensin family protein [Neptunicoccus sediminis]|uniref:extensin-like domain-containing protein n=1 Tax=Neptunicoccus sediminis TaxID=1892596 RepID=UPI000846045F|nr:extensin family protein [Neptunicoccus sediminis]